MAYPHPYLELYNASAAAIKSVHPSLQVGGPASAGLAFVQDFVDDTKRYLTSPAHAQYASATIPFEVHPHHLEL